MLPSLDCARAVIFGEISRLCLMMTLLALREADGRGWMKMMPIVELTLLSDLTYVSAAAAGPPASVSTNQALGSSI